MEICYDGALVMPSNYAVMDEEKMTYTEGGAYLNIISTDWAGALFNVALSAAIGGGGIVGSGLASYIKKVGKKEAGKLFSKTIATKLKALGLASLAGMVPLAIDTVLDHLDVGAGIAGWLDNHDASGHNGYLSIPLPW